MNGGDIDIVLLTHKVFVFCFKSGDLNYMKVLKNIRDKNASAALIVGLSNHSIHTPER